MRSASTIANPKTILLWYLLNVDMIDRRKVRFVVLTEENHRYSVFVTDAPDVFLSVILCGLDCLLYCL